MNVVFSSSDLYAKCTGVAIYSLLVTNTDLSELTIFLLTTDMTIENQQIIIKMVESHNRKIVIIPATDILKKAQKELGLPIFKGGLNTYARAIANQVLPAHIDRALFVDSDIVFNGSLSEIESMDMSGTIVAGVPEVMLMTRCVCYEDVDILNQCSNYLNYGVVFFDLQNWRKFEGDKLIKKCIKDNDGQFRIAEQSILNLAFNKYTKILPVKYNFYTMLHGQSYQKISKWYPRRKLFDEKEFKDATNKPVIIHFVGDYFNRPWYRDNICRFKDTYMKYYKESPWGEESLECVPQDISVPFKIYYAVLIFLRKNKYDDLYFYFRYIWVQWIRERIPSIDTIRRRRNNG